MHRLEIRAKDRRTQLELAFVRGLSANSRGSRLLRAFCFPKTRFFIAGPRAITGTRPGTAGPTGLQSPAAPCALRLLIGWLVVGILACQVSPAFAQVNRLGFRVGEKSKLHLNLDVSSIFDTNSLRRQDNPNTEGQDEGADQEDFRLAIRPHLELDVPGRSVEFRLGLGATISQFFGIGAQTPEETLIGADANLFLRLGSSRSLVSFTLDNSPLLTPTVLPDLGSIGADERLFNAFTDTGRAYFTLRPGGGALEFDVGYRNQFTLFIRDDSDSAPDDAFTHAAFLEARWEFLPKTSFLFHADFGWFDPVPADPGRDEITNPVTLESNPYSIMIGMVGQITRTVSAELRLGYGETLVWARGQDRFSELDPANQRDFIMLASATWQVIKTAKLSLAYERRVDPMVALSSVVSNAFRFRGNLTVGRLVAGIYSELQLRDFGTQVNLLSPGPAEAQVEQEPFALLVFGGLRADYYFLDWFSGGLNYRLLFQDSNDDDRIAAPAVGRFTRHQALVNLSVRY